MQVNARCAPRNDSFERTVPLQPALKKTAACQRTEGGMVTKIRLWGSRAGTALVTGEEQAFVWGVAVALGLLVSQRIHLLESVGCRQVGQSRLLDSQRTMHSRQNTCPSGQPDVGWSITIIHTEHPAISPPSSSHAGTIIIPVKDPR